MYKKRSELFDSNMVYFFLIAFFIVVRIVASTFEISSVGGYILNLVIQVGLMFCLPVFVYSWLRKQKVKTTLKSYGFVKISPKAIFLSIGIGILVYGLTVCISSVFSLILSTLGYDPYGSSSVITEYPTWLFLLEIVFTAVLPGICEEVAHRGMLINAYKPVGLKKAILLSGLLFGLMHLNIEQAFYATLIGFLFGLISIATGSIVPTMIMHFVNNALSVYLTYAKVNNLPFGNLFDNITLWFQTTNAFVVLFAIFMAISIMVGLLFVFMLKLVKEVRVKQLTKVTDDAVKQQLRKQLFEGTSLENQNNEQTGVSIEKNAEIGTKTLYNIKYPSDMFLIKRYRPTFKDNIFLYGSLFLGIVITIFTFVWGVI